MLDKIPDITQADIQNILSKILFTTFLKMLKGYKKERAEQETSTRGRI